MQETEGIKSMATGRGCGGLLKENHGERVDQVPSLGVEIGPSPILHSGNAGPNGTLYYEIRDEPLNDS